MGRLNRTALRARIQTENARFNALSKNEKRIEIARDVISQLELQRFEAEHGLYVDSSIKVTNPELDLSETILASNDSCRVCGIGGFFISAVCKGDNLKTEDAVEDTGYVDVSGDTAYDYLAQFFSNDQLTLIEAAFEQNPSFSEHRDAYLAAEFGDEVGDNNTRLRLIAENIIVNKGRFDPRKKPVQVWTTVGFSG